jgi:hypothetical protein
MRASSSQGILDDLGWRLLTQLINSQHPLVDITALIDLKFLDLTELDVFPNRCHPSSPYCPSFLHIPTPTIISFSLFLHCFVFGSHKVLVKLSENKGRETDM